MHDGKQGEYLCIIHSSQCVGCLSSRFVALLTTRSLTLFLARWTIISFLDSLSSTTTTKTIVDDDDAICSFTHIDPSATAHPSNFFGCTFSVFFQFSIRMHFHSYNRSSIIVFFSTFFQKQSRFIAFYLFSIALFALYSTTLHFDTMLI